MPRKKADTGEDAPKKKSKAKSKAKPKSRAKASQPADLSAAKPKKKAKAKTSKKAKTSPPADASAAKPKKKAKPKSKAKSSKKSTSKAKSSKKTTQAKSSKKATRRKKKEPFELLHELESPLAKVLSTGFSPDDSQVAVGDDVGLVVLVDRASGEVVKSLKGHTHSVLGVAFDPEGEHLVSTGLDSTIRLWSVAEGRFLRDLSGTIARTPRARTLRGQFVRGSTLAHTRAALCLAWHESNIIATGGQDRLVKIWRDGHVIRTFDWHTGPVTSVHFRPGTDDVLSTSRDRTLRLWSVSTGAMLNKYEAHQDAVTCAAWIGDDRIVSGDMSGVILLWDAEQEQVLKTIESGDGSAIRSLVATPDGKKLYVGFESGDIACYALRTRKVTARCEAHILAVRCLAITSDGKCLASGGIDGTLRLWSIT